MNNNTVKSRHSVSGLAIRGRWSDAVTAHREELIERCISLGSRISGEPDMLGLQSVFVKGGPLPPSAAKRHRWRRVLLGAPLPALAEFQAAEWLRKRLFQTPEPLAAIEAHSTEGLCAVGIERIRRPVSQLLVTAAVPGAVTFQAAWATMSELDRDAACGELGTEVGRMHALHFLHADLYPRNVLVARGGKTERSLWFIDSWAGGATAWRNGSFRRLESDLGTWLTEFEAGLDGAHLKALLAAYAEARYQNGRPIRNLGRWLGTVQESRRRELRRLERQRYRLRGTRFPQAGLAMPGMAERIG